MSNEQIFLVQPLYAWSWHRDWFFNFLFILFWQKYLLPPKKKKWRKKPTLCIEFWKRKRSNMNREWRIYFPVIAPISQRCPIFHTECPHRTLSARLSPGGYKVPVPLVLSWRSRHGGIWRRDRDPFWGEKGTEVRRWGRCYPRLVLQEQNQSAPRKRGDLSDKTTCHFDM